MPTYIIINVYTHINQGFWHAVNAKFFKGEHFCGFMTIRKTFTFICIYHAVPYNTPHVKIFSLKSSHHM